jgi:hypothetical protein
MADMNKMPAGGIVPSRDIKPLADEIQAILDAGGGPPPAGGAIEGAAKGGEMGAPGGEMGAKAPAPGGKMGGEMGDEMAVLADTLGVSAEKAQALYDAAQMMPKLAGKSPAELAMMLEKDMNLRMQLEKNIGAGEDTMARKAMASEGMKAPAAGPPPMEPTPGPMKK